MNKSTKIRLNYLLGIIVSAVLLWSIYRQVTAQLAHIDPKAWWHTGPLYLLWVSLLLMPVNLGLEAWKWKLLAGSAEPLTYQQAWGSYLAGIAFSLVTPNRIGEYPGRILYLKRKNTIRLISVSVLGAFAQLFAVLFFGILGLVYYNIAFPGMWEKIVLASCVLLTTGVVILYLRFEYWAQWIARVSWLRKFRTYGHLLKRFTVKEQVVILLISLLRFFVFTAQYLILLTWMNVSVPLVAGFCMAALFFWAMAVIPSVALAELGIRGQVSLFLFHHFSGNSIGILAATIILWCINLVLPSVIGSILLIRLRLLR
ncbi:lysylphosphatidylglycerol synthase domain-containing protein [Chitinophagaceae bacterium MMS25-I14]